MIIYSNKFFHDFVEFFFTLNIGSIICRHSKTFRMDDLRKNFLAPEQMEPIAHPKGELLLAACHAVKIFVEALFYLYARDFLIHFHKIFRKFRIFFQFSKGIRST